jgi:hypothetical protein
VTSIGTTWPAQASDGSHCRFGPGGPGRHVHEPDIASWNTGAAWLGFGTGRSYVDVLGYVSPDSNTGRAPVDGSVRFRGGAKVCGNELS